MGCEIKGQALFIYCYIKSTLTEQTVLLLTAWWVRYGIKGTTVPVLNLPFKD